MMPGISSVTGACDQGPGVDKPEPSEPSSGQGPSPPLPAQSAQSQERERADITSGGSTHGLGYVG